MYPYGNPAALFGGVKDKRKHLLELRKLYQEAISKIDEKIKEEESYPRYPVGAVYSRTSTDSLYAIVDWNGIIRVLNITNNTFWKSGQITSRFTHSMSKGNREKAEYLTQPEFEKVLGLDHREFKVVGIKRSDLS